MMIKVDQSLHGYQNGHQLLASSRGFSMEERKTLLFQTDLSGSAITEGFESYITGYPLNGSSIYCISKTWYANEMRRPGCVWTHTIFINFPDLGKIPELRGFSSFFKRPTINEYSSYEEPMMIDISNESNEIEIEDDLFIGLKQRISLNLYNNHNQTVIIPSKSSHEFERVVLDLWSDQWPRLRRNFTFCTGALSIKKIYGRSFDLQVVPEKNMMAIERNSKEQNLIFLGKMSHLDESLESDKITILFNYPKSEIRELLWVYGSDVVGNRENYLPLLAVLKLLLSKKSKLDEIAQAVSASFPFPSEASLLKLHIFGPVTPFEILYSEKEVLTYLIVTKYVDFLELDRLDIEKRLVQLIAKDKISIDELVNIWKCAVPGRIGISIWQYVNLNEANVLKLIENDDSLIDLIVSRSTDFAASPVTWRTNDRLQRKVYSALLGRGEVLDWKPYIKAVLLAKSDLIYTIDKDLHSICIEIILEWLNVQNVVDKYSLSLGQYVLQNYENDFIHWIRYTDSDINANMFVFIFTYLEYNKIPKLGLKADDLIHAYKYVASHKELDTSVQTACSLLALGFKNKFSESQKVVSEIFHDVYSYAASNKIRESVWKRISSDELEVSKDEEKEDFYLFSIISNMLLGFFSNNSERLRRKEKVHYWDYCEQLIRTFSAKSIKYSWSSQSFLNALKNELAFQRVVVYMLNFQSGKQYLRKVRTDVETGEIKALAFQEKLLVALNEKAK